MLIKTKRYKEGQEDVDEYESYIIIVEINLDEKS